MATRRWVGKAKAVAQVSSVQVTAYDVATTYILTVNTKTVSVIAQGSANATASALATAWNALTFPEYAEITASSSTDTVTLTGDTAGKPFAVSKSTSGGTGTMGSVTAVTAATGPNHWDNANNWKEGSVPVAGDDVIIDEGPSILYALDQNAVTLTTLKIGPNFLSTSEIGLPSNTVPSNPSSGYPEYRDQRLKIGATTATIETVSRRVRLDLSPATTTVTVRSTGQAQNVGEDSLDLVVDNAGGSSAVYLLSGSIGLVYQPGDSATIADVNVSNGVTLRCGTGLTLTNLDMSGGAVTLNNGAVTITKRGGSLTLLAGAVTTLTNRGGEVLDYSTGTITTLTNKGHYRKLGFAAKTVANATIYAGSQTIDANGVVTWTNPPQFNECRLPESADDREPDVAYANFGVHKKLTVAAI